MKVESSIQENLISTTTQPITDTEEIISAICEWNEITREEFNSVIWDYSKIGTDENWKPIYMKDWYIIYPIEMYLENTYSWKTVVFEKWNDKFFWKIEIIPERTRYQLWDKVIEISYKIKAVNKDTESSIILFPKKKDILQGRMTNLYVVNNGWAERQRIEKEIMAKLIELSMVRWWNEIIETQNKLEELKETLARRGIELILWTNLGINIPRRKVRDVAWNDREYMAPPIELSINFDTKGVRCRWYSSHWFGTPNSWWNPCWWNYAHEITNSLMDCDLKGLINLLIIWAYGYNSGDTWRQYTDRHPIAKLRDYIWYVYEHKDSEGMDKEITEIKNNIKDIVADLDRDKWLEDCESWIKNFILWLDKNETAE